MHHEKLCHLWTIKVSKIIVLGFLSSLVFNRLPRNGDFWIHKINFMDPTGSVFTNQLQERSLSFSPTSNKLECYATSDWLNRMVKPIRCCVTFKCC